MNPWFLAVVGLAGAYWFTRDPRLAEVKSDARSRYLGHTQGKYGEPVLTVSESGGWITIRTESPKTVFVWTYPRQKRGVISVKERIDPKK